jgi:hypothetical protein
MEANTLHLAASIVAGRNVTPLVAAVRIAWDDGLASLTVHYLVDGVITEEERELCELTAGELIAEFPDIGTVHTECYRTSSAPALHGQDVVYARASNRQRAA